MMRIPLKAIRAQIGITQEELAARSGVSRGLIARIETGRITDIRLSTLAKLAGAMGLTLTELVRRIEVLNGDSDQAAD